MATLLEKGEKGFPRDPKNAFAWHYLLARKGDLEAMHTIAYYFIRGLHGVKSDLAAAHWYHQGAMAGNRDSAEAYAWMLREGVGVAKDADDAEFWANRSRDLGS